MVLYYAGLFIIGGKSMDKNKKKSLMSNMLIMAVIPVVLLAAIIAIAGYCSFTSAMNTEIEDELDNVSKLILNYYDSEYPGDYYVRGDNELMLFKGDTALNGENRYIDCVKEDTGLDISLFYDNIRFQTTIKDESGERVVGTTAHIKVVTEVLDTNTPKLYTNSTIAGETYYAYYVPVTNSDGTCVGMLAIAKQIQMVNKTVIKSIVPLALISVIAAAVIGCIMARYAKGIVRKLKMIQTSMDKVSDGNLAYKIDKEITDRTDEFGDMGKAVNRMQKSLRELIELDMLTGLNNRRFAEKQIKEIRDKSTNNGMEYSIAIGDIDFFKKVNDTYGHDCGDEALKFVSMTLRNNLKGKGFAARWGGEEFLLVFDRCQYDEAVKTIELIRHQIENTVISYNDITFRISMTFGIVKGDNSLELNKLLVKADDRLYYGKQNGRNRLVSSDEDMR